MSLIINMPYALNVNFDSFNFLADLQNKMIENQEKYIRKDTCDKIADIVIREMQKK